MKSPEQIASEITALAYLSPFAYATERIRDGIVKAIQSERDEVGRYQKAIDTQLGEIQRLEKHLEERSAEVERLRALSEWAHTCAHHNDQQRAALTQRCPVCLQAEVDRLKAGGCARRLQAELDEAADLLKGSIFMTSEGQRQAAAWLSRHVRGVDKAGLVG